MCKGLYIVCLVASSALLAGCQPETLPTEDAPLETVDMAEDPNFSPDEDPRAAPRQGQLAGVLPDDFPGDLPLHLPASVEEIGTAGGRRRVGLTTSSTPDQVRTALSGALRGRGWRGSVRVGESAVEKDGRTVRVTIEKARFGSLYAFEY